MRCKVIPKAPGDAGESEAIPPPPQPEKQKLIFIKHETSKKYVKNSHNETDFYK